jgi:hypothetical protein
MKMTSCNLRAYPSLKGIYTAFFLMCFFTSAYSQIEKKESTAFNKWEVGIDLRPLIDKKTYDYTFIVRKHFSPLKSYRIGIRMNVNYEKYDTVFTIKDRFRQTDIGLFLGYQHEKKFKNITVYSATDISFNYYRLNAFVITVGIAVSGQPTTQVDNFPWEYNKFFGLGISQAIGVRYTLNSNISLSLESRIGLTYYNGTMRNGYVNRAGSFVANAYERSGSSTYLTLIPLSFLCLNYHF